jgi:integrase
LDSLTLRQLIERYRDTVVIAKRSRENETTTLNALLRHGLVNSSLSALSPSRFRDYCDERLTKIAPATLLRELNIIQHMFETARRDWAIPIPNNPIKFIAKPKSPLPRSRRLRPGEQERLLGSCVDCRNPLIKPLIVLALETAMRLGELLRIEAGQIRYETRTLLIPITKNGHPRTCPASAIVRQKG